MDAPPVPIRSSKTKLTSNNYLPIDDTLPPPPPLPPPITNLEISAHQFKRRSIRHQSELNSKPSSRSGSNTTPSPDIFSHLPNNHINLPVDLTNCTLNTTSEMSNTIFPGLVSPSDLPPPPDSLLFCPQLMHELQEEFIQKQIKDKVPPPITKPKPSFARSPGELAPTSPFSSTYCDQNSDNNKCSINLDPPTERIPPVDNGVTRLRHLPKYEYIDSELSPPYNNSSDRKNYNNSLGTLSNTNFISSANRDSSVFRSLLTGPDNVNVRESAPFQHKLSLSSSSDPNLLNHNTIGPTNSIRPDRNLFSSNSQEYNILNNQTADTLAAVEVDELELLLADLDLLAKDLANESKSLTSSNVPVSSSPPTGKYSHTRTASTDGFSLLLSPPSHRKITRLGTLAPSNLADNTHHHSMQPNCRVKSLLNNHNMKDVPNLPAQPNPSSDRDMMFTTSLQVDSHYETLNDFDQSFASHRNYNMFNVLPDKRYSATNSKTDKIKIAMEKLKLANVRRAVLKVHDSQGSYKMAVVDQYMTARQVCNTLIEKNHLEPGPNWTLTEQLTDLKLDRNFEDHELVLNSISHWPRQHKNILLFKNNPDKYLLLKKPQLLMPITHPLSSFNDSTFDEVTRRRILIKELFQDSNLPRISGNLSMKEGKRGSWKRYFCVLRSSGLYYARPGKTTTKDLTRLVSWEDITLYRGSKYTEFYKAPNKHCFSLRPDNCTASLKSLYHFSFQSKSQLEVWITGISLAKHSLQLLFNYQENFAIFPWLENDIDMTTCSPSASMTNVVPRSQESALTEQERALLHTEVPNLKGSNPLIDSFNFLDDQRSRKSNDFSDLEKTSSCGKSSRIADNFSKAWSISEGIERSPKSFVYSRSILPHPLPDRSSQLSSSTQNSSPGLVYEPPHIYNETGRIGTGNQSGKKIETFV